MEDLHMEMTAENGNPLGIVRYSCYDWQGAQYKIPRNMIFSNQPTVQNLANQTCVYILAGEYNGKSAYYIGEAENCIARIKQHKNEDWWNDALIFVGNHEYPLDKAQVKYIENALYLEAKNNAKNKSFTLMNSNTPATSSLSHQSEIRTKKYIEMAKNSTLFQYLKIFVKQEEFNPQTQDILTISRDNKILAYGYRTTNGFMVQKNATITPTMTEKTTQCFKNFRQKLITDGIIKNNKLAVNYEFSSPSAAAVQILGHNSNGLDEWKNSTGQKLKDIER